MEKLMVVPLRKARRGSKERFAPKAINYLKGFAKRHMKAGDVIIGNELNEFIWSQGVRNPPRRVEIKAVRKENTAYVEISSIAQEKWKKFVGEDAKKKKEKAKETKAPAPAKKSKKGRKTTKAKGKAASKAKKGTKPTKAKKVTAKPSKAEKKTKKTETKKASKPVKKSKTTTKKTAKPKSAKKTTKTKKATAKTKAGGKK